MERGTLRFQCDAYLLGLLDGEDLREFEAALRASGAEGKALLAESTDVVAKIGLTAPLVDPPALLRTRLLKSLAPEPVVAAPPKPRGRLLAFAGWAVAAGLAVVSYLGLQNNSRLQGDLTATQQELAGLRIEAGHMKKVLSVVMARDARIIRLATSVPEAPQLRAFWSKPTGLVLTGLNMPMPAAGRTMQLWIVPKSGNPISAGVFRPESGGQVLLVTASAAAPEDAKALAISDEPEGGSAQPTTTPAWVGAVGD